MDILDRITQVVTRVKKLTLICYPDYDLSIGSLTLFAKSASDYHALIKSLSEIGEKAPTNNGMKFILTNNLNILGEKIKKVRVRQADIHRKEVGCCDLIYPKDKYNEMRETALRKKYDIIVRRNFEMIELATFDINAYAYIVKNH